MFTGIIERVGLLSGRISSGKDGKLSVIPAQPFDGALTRGESIAVNGCCLTLEKVEGNALIFHTLAETLRCTNLGKLAIGAPVNLERALRLDSRLGGHLVSGHIDGAGRIRAVRRPEGDYELEIAYPPDFAPFLIAKGSIAVDGVSLTIQTLTAETFCVRLIPTTRDDTALTVRGVGSEVNLETDLIGKYVRRQLHPEESTAATFHSAPDGITMNKLRDAGFF